MRFVFLGTSAGVPTRQRNVTALALQPDLNQKSWVLIDCGEGCQRQLQWSPCSLAKVDAVFITHMHGDHVLGLPGLVSTRNLFGVDRPLTLVGPPGLEVFVREACRATATRLSEGLTFVDCSQMGVLSFAGFSVQARPLRHNVPSWAYQWQESKAPARRFLAEKAQKAGIPPGPAYRRLKLGETVTLDDGRCFDGVDFLDDEAPALYDVVIGGDNASPDVLAPYLGKTQLLIHEATYMEAEFAALEAKLEAKRWHSTAAGVARLAEKVGLPHLILTHFSPRYDDAGKIAALADEAKAHYRGDVQLARDFASYELTRGGELRYEQLV